jgi:hypothetical protein
MDSPGFFLEVLTMPAADFGWSEVEAELAPRKIDAWKLLQYALLKYVNGHARMTGQQKLDAAFAYIANVRDANKTDLKGALDILVKDAQAAGWDLQPGHC